MAREFIKIKYSQFFDRSAVMRAEPAARRRALSKIGAYVRTRARTSILKRKAVAPPGRPPHSHSGELRRLIFFGYDSRRSVVIGPVPFPGAKGGLSGAALLEYGGSRVSMRGRRQRYRGHPFMRPALQKEIEVGTLAEAFRNSIR